MPKRIRPSYVNEILIQELFWGNISELVAWRRPATTERFPISLREHLQFGGSVPVNLKETMNSNLKGSPL